MFKIQYNENNYMDDFIDQALIDLNEFFKFENVQPKPKLIVMENRETLTKLSQFKTNPMIRGFSLGGNIYVLDLNYLNEKDNRPTTKDEYEKLIKHELTHVLTWKYKQNGYLPSWVMEGVAIHLSNQITLLAPIDKFEYIYTDNYKESFREYGFAFKLLIEKYGTDKVFNLIRSSKSFKNNKDFESKFNELFNSKPTLEFFNQLL